MNSMIAIFARPAMRKNPHSWCRMYYLWRARPSTRPGHMLIDYKIADIGFAPNWVQR